LRVLDASFGTPKAVAELTLLVPVQGGSVHETIGFFGVNTPKGQNRTSEITVIVDPDNEIKESNERNNALIMKGTCYD
jgi:subtilase family serine protease